MSSISYRKIDKLLRRNPTPSNLRLKLLEEVSSGLPCTFTYAVVNVAGDEFEFTPNGHIVYVLSDMNKAALIFLMKMLDQDMRENSFCKDIIELRRLVGRPEVLKLESYKDDLATSKEELFAVKKYIVDLFKAASPPPSICHMLHFLEDRNMFMKCREFILSHTALWSQPEIVGTYNQICGAYKREPETRALLRDCAFLKYEGKNWFNGIEKKISQLERSVHFDSDTITAETEWFRVTRAFRKVLRHDRMLNLKKTGVYKDFHAEIGFMFYTRDVFSHFSEHIIKPEIRLTQMVQLFEYLEPTYLANFAFSLYVRDIKLYNRFFPRNS